MVKHAVISLSMLMLAALCWASGPLSASSKLMVRRHKADISKNALSPQGEAIQAFIALDDVQSGLDSLRRCGVTVHGCFDGFVTATIPWRALAEATRISAVNHIALARPLSLCNDTARWLSHVDVVQSGIGRVAPLTGRGVIVGVIDTGIDFNHINLLDNDGQSRVVAVYMPCDTTGTHPVVQGEELPGSCYETPAQIASLTTDCTNSSHGTHTAGTAVGGYKANSWHGVACEAGLVACGMPEEEFTDVNIANALKYVFDYAERMDMPCVVNMSIGSNEGPNDGTSFLCRVFNSLTGPGRICVLSAGNDGNVPICFHGTITSRADTLTTLLRGNMGSLQRKGYVSMWSAGAQVHGTRLVIINRSTGQLEYASPMLSSLPGDSVFSISSDWDAEFAAYYSGEVLFANAMEQLNDDDSPNQQERFHSIWVFDVTSVRAGHLIGLQYVADEPVALAGWSTKNAYFYTFGLEGVTGGTEQGSISDLATTDSVISVGAYCSRSSWIDNDGGLNTIQGCNPGDIAAFSSFGPDENGVTRPDVCAPGMALISSANRFALDEGRQHWPASAMVDGIEYPYYVNQGTSMSAPVVTGAVALMLQLNPDLAPYDVRQVLARSSRRDSYVSDDVSRWGFGKLDVEAAVGDVLENTVLHGDVNGDHEINIADVMALVDLIIGSGADSDAATRFRADVNRDGEIQLSDINRVIDLILLAMNINHNNS